MKQWKKQIALAMATVTFAGLLAGCGTEDKIGYVDVAKIRTQSLKAKQIEQQVADRRAAVMQRLAEAQQTQSPEQFQKTVTQADEEMQVYRMAMSKEFQNAVDAAAADVARSKKLSIVVDSSAIPAGGEDVTDAVLEKINATAKDAADTQAKAQKEVEAAAAQEAAKNGGDAKANEASNAK